MNLVLKQRDQGKKGVLLSQYFLLFCIFLRLEWESIVLRGVDTFQSLEEERLNCLKNALESYVNHTVELNPKLNEVCILFLFL